MAAREGREAGGKTRHRAFSARELFPERRSDPGQRTTRCTATQKAGALVNNNENTSARPRAMRQEPKPQGSDHLESFGKTLRASRRSAARGAKEMKISRLGHHAATERCKRRAPRRPIVEACRSLLIPSSDGLGRARPAGPAIVNACRSLLIPRRHFGAAGGAGVFAFWAGRFLPLAGSVGSSCA